MRKFILLIILVSPYILFSQFSGSFESNNQYYVDDSKVKFEDPDDKSNSDPLRFRSNSYLSLNYTFDKLEFKLQGENYRPGAIIGFNPDFNEKTHIGFASLRYRDYDSGVDVTAGHMYEQFGSGLALRFSENRSTGVNNALLGGRIIFSFEDMVTLKVLGGKQRIGMGFDLSSGIVYGSDIELNLGQMFGVKDLNLTFGGSYVGKAEDVTAINKNLPITISISGPRFEYSTDNFNINSEFLLKSDDVHREGGLVMSGAKSKGQALLVNTSYNIGGFSANVNFRKLENFPFFSQFTEKANSFSRAMINFTPNLTKQYKFSLQNIYVYTPQGLPLFTGGRDLNGTFENIPHNGDIGGQMDLNYQFDPNTPLGGKHGMSLTLNTTYWAGTTFKQVKDMSIPDMPLILNLKPSGGLLNFGKKFYRDFGFEVKKTTSDIHSIYISYLHQDMDLDYFLTKGGQVKAHTFGMDNSFVVTDHIACRLEMQYHTATGYYKNWMAGLFEFNIGSHFSFFIQDMYNYRTFDKESKIDLEKAEVLGVKKKLHYYTLGGAVNYKATRLSVSYGRQRAGLFCVGGVCRSVPKSNGFTINLTTRF